ncbi:MAG: sugar transferase, partial [Roseburia sp.]|nr:sugar transferase [Roseburia sp.]
MNEKEQYKHLLNYGANLLALLVEGCTFAYIWYTVYVEEFGFWRRGNWAVIGLYMLIIYFFTKVFGGYNIGYMRTTDIALSHVLAIILSGIVGYLELCLVCRDYVSPKPMFGAVAVELIFILPWVYVVRKLYAWLYPPRQMLVIYGHYPPDELIAKINTRKDKYNICASVSYEVGYETLYP